MKVEDVKKIAVVGSGDMGHGIAEVAAMAGYKVNMYDIKQEFVDKGLGKIKDSLTKQVSKQKMTQEAMDKIMGSLTGFTVLKDAVKDVDFMVEAAPEILDLKQKIFKECDEFAPKHAILASNTSNMSITKIAAATKRPDKVVGLHFFNPVAMMLLVEVIRGDKTSDETMNVSADLVKGWKNFRGAMVAIRVEKDTPGFIYNRLGAPAGLYLAILLEKGTVNPEAADAKVRSIGAPMGPYETMDFAGLDIMMHSMKYFAEVLSPEFKPKSWLEKKNADGQLGKKVGKGLFDWPGGARPTIDLSKADPNFDPMNIMCLEVNEGTKLLEAGVAKSAAEIDLAMVNGGGGIFGPFALCKGMGWDKVAQRCEEISKQMGITWFMPTETLKKGNIQL
ncbi:MAG: 3-hydroxyacyl-CoA dehydrogenase family protein [Chloroflexi bacterium]|nr:3-hydroxyacyl-CoA dehydrogenase family protein [Chloroflexota bacterium]